MTPAHWLAVALVFSFLPIWRGAGHSRHDGVSLWQLVYESSTRSFEESHIRYEDAVRRAQEAYQAKLRGELL